MLFGWPLGVKVETAPREGLWSVVPAMVRTPVETLTVRFPTLIGAGRVTVKLLLFFFSSRRRHTRCSRDWSRRVLFRSHHGKRPGRNIPVEIAADGVLRGQDVFHGGCNGRAVRIFLDIQVLDAFAVSDAAVADAAGVLGDRKSVV